MSQRDIYHIVRQSNPRVATKFAGAVFHENQAVRKQLAKQLARGGADIKKTWQQMPTIAKVVAILVAGIAVGVVVLGRSGKRSVGVAEWKRTHNPFIRNESMDYMDKILGGNWLDHAREYLWECNDNSGNKLFLNDLNNVSLLDEYGGITYTTRDGLEWPTASDDEIKSLRNGKIYSTRQPDLWKTNSQLFKFAMTVDLVRVKIEQIVRELYKDYDWSQNSGANKEYVLPWMTNKVRLIWWPVGKIKKSIEFFINVVLDKKDTGGCGSGAAIGTISQKVSGPDGNASLVDLSDLDKSILVYGNRELNIGWGEMAPNITKHEYTADELKALPWPINDAKKIVEYLNLCNAKPTTVTVADRIFFRMYVLNWLKYGTDPNAIIA